MNFIVLGPIGVEDAEAPLKLDGPRIKALLAYLLLHANRPVPTSELLDALWGEEHPRSGATAVQNAVVRLRRSLGDRVVTAGSGYLVRVEDGELDLLEFRRLCGEAENAPPRERATLLGDAVGLWQGAALGGIEAAAFTAREAAALEDERLAAVAGRVDAELALGRHAELVPALSTLVAEHPLDERFRALLIVALYRSGRQAAALDVYRETRRLLMDELGLEPSPELRDLERAVLTQDPALDRPAVEPRVEETMPPAAAPPAVAPPRDRAVRRGLLVVATTAALAIAGAALAVALTHHDRSAAGTATTLFQISRVTTTTANTHHRPAVKHVVSKKQGTAPTVPAVPQPHVTTVVVATTEPPTTTPHVPATTASITTHAPKTPASTTPATITRPTTTAATTAPKQPLKAEQVYWIADDFTAQSIDSDRWHLASHGTGVTASRQDGSLEFAIGSDATADPTYGVDTHYGTQCLLTGDFDATVDYRLLQWPENDGMWLGFGLYHPPPDESYFAIERRGSTTGGGVESYGASGGGFVRTSDGSGSLRLRRNGSRLTMYYRHNGRWVALGTVTADGPSQLILTFAGNDPGFGHQPASAAFDDFVAQADKVSCPELPLPPRKQRG